MSAQLQTPTKASIPAPHYTPVQSGLLQRACACGNHSGGECASCREKREGSLQRSAINSGPATAPPIVHDVLRSPGQPLDPATRAFMEPRFGHDFSRVRVHTDSQAAESAQAVNALAYAVGSHIAFGAAQYAPGTPAGQRLLAHELTHTLQQAQAPSAGMQMASALEVGDPNNSYEREAEAQAARVVEGRATAPASVSGRLGVARLQRQADISKAPKGLPCILTTGPGHLPGTDVLFDISSTALIGSAKTDIAAFAKAWATGGSQDDVIVDGWASVDGPQELNWELSCKRAEAVKTELGKRGVPDTKVTTFAHGESTEFSTTDLAKNRRAIITRQPAVGPTPKPTPTPTPTPKADLERVEVNIQPVSIADDDGKNPTTIPSFASAKAIWGKCCVTLTVAATKTVSKTSFRVLDEDPATDTFTPTAEEKDLMKAAGAGGGTISVIVPETFKNGANVSKNIDGGGVTYMPNRADATCFLVEGSDPTNVAHELGHAMGNGSHDAGTVMAGSGAFDKPNLDKVSASVCSNVRTFAFGKKSGKVDCAITTP